MIATQHPQPTAPESQTNQQEGWEVDEPDGTHDYRGYDLTLADELYHLLPQGAHIHRVPADDAERVTR
jgi:hypothetical protein